MPDRSKIIVVFLSLMFSGCVKELEVDFGESSRKIVLYPFLTSNQPISIKMSAPAGILSDEFPVLSNPVVVITDNDVPVDTVIINSNGKGFSDIVPEKDHMYGFYASADGYHPASCNSQLPEPVQFIQIDTSLFRHYGSTYINFRIRIKDNPNSTDYYKISIYKKDYVTAKIIRVVDHNFIEYDTSYTKRWDLQIFANNPVMEFFSNWSSIFFLAKEEIKFFEDGDQREEIGSEVYYRGKEFYFTDNLINGKETVLKMLVPEYHNSSSPQRYMIELSSISGDYYLGLKSYAAYGSKEGLNLPVNEEVSIYSAVKGGYGFPVAYVSVCDSSYWVR